jgi:hypothetical protein
MWNDSFSGEAPTAGGGWGGDMSFNTGAPKDSQTNKIADRLPVPVTISELLANVGSDEKFVLGDMAFSTVLVMGIVEDVADDTTSTIYTISDPEDSSKQYNVTIYRGVDESNVTPVFERGTRVVALGKLRSLADNNGIMAYDVMETSEKEYHAYTLEAKIARLFFTKNVALKLQAGEADMLAGTCVGAPAPSDGSSRTMHSNVNMPSSTSCRAPVSAGGAATENDGAYSNFTGQRAAIMRLMNAEKDICGEQGLTFTQVHEKIAGSTFEAIKKDMEFLAAEGHLYATISDETYAVVDSN